MTHGSGQHQPGDGPTGPLTGIRVADFCHAVVGPWAGMLLGALGADVIKVEQPGRGDGMRAQRPAQNGLSVTYTHANLNKRGIILDLKSEEGGQAARRLVESADVLLHNMRPQVMKRLGFDYDQVSPLNPQLVYVAACGWGRSGPLADMGGIDPTVQLFSGWAGLNGAPGGKAELSRYGVYIDATTSGFLLGATLLGLLHRLRTGKGLRIDTTMLGAALHIQLSRLGEFFATGVTPPRMGSATATTAPHQAFLCQDGKWVAVGVINDRQWESLCRALEVDSLRDSRFATNPGRVEHREELASILEKVFHDRPSTWWSICLSRAGVPNGPFLDFTTIRYHSHFRDNGFLVDLDVPQQGRMVFAGPPWRFSETPARLHPGPLPGEHTKEVLKELHSTSLSPRRVGGPGVASAASASAPLEGLRVIDVTQGLAGPYTSQLLVDAGAEVIKIEPPQGDYARRWGPPFDHGEGAAFLQLNRGKKSVVLDLEHRTGREALLGLLADADLFIEDLGPGKAEAHGIGYETLRKTNPRLVYVALTPFGEEGPLRDVQGCELVYQAMAEAWASLGAPGRPPERLGADQTAFNTGSHTFAGILAALYYRALSGRGQRVSTSLMGSMLHMRGILWSSLSNPDSWVGHLISYTRPPDHAYQTRDWPVYFNLRRGDEANYVGILAELNMTHVLEDPRFQDGGREALAGGRFIAEVKPIWEEAFKNFTADELTALVRKHKGDCVGLNDYERLMAHPQIQALGLLTEAPHPGGGYFRTLGSAWELQGVPAPASKAPPRLGQHTAEVLGAVH